MRTIPPELLNRVKKKWQSKAENADPKMKILLSRGFLNELFQVFTIQDAEEFETLTDVDVTVRRQETGELPSEIFALAVKDDVAEVLSKDLPYDDQAPWIHHFTVAAFVTSVAIEFDGYWDRDYKTRRFNFVTEDYPWLFYVKGGSLYGQFWDGEPFKMATGVSKVAAIRGWVPVAGDLTNDQGLIVCYLKTDGSVWYRNYCIQADGTKDWEVARKVEELDGSDNISLFRTNDFRIGFIGEISGEISWLFTERNYAGMSYWPERLTGKFIGFTKIKIIPIEELDLIAPPEHLTGEFDFFCIGLNNPDDLVGTCTGGEILDDYTLSLEFTQPLVGDISRIAKYIIVGNEADTEFYTVVSTAKGDANELIITLLEEIDTENNVKVTVGDGVICLQPSYVGSMLPMAAFSEIISLAKTPYHLVCLTGNFGFTKSDLIEILSEDTAVHEAGRLTGEFNGFTIITFTKVGGGDV
ncbi:MAG: hypothetical protein ACOYCB_13115 [Fastidiosipilaceae bacterium]|jgi:hypothetical protein